MILPILRCLMCGSDHAAAEGITEFTRQFKCPDDGTEWEDVWCADCNDKCPQCNKEIEPASTEDRVIVEPKEPL